jgi:site-specific recombinase XerD
MALTFELSRIADSSSRKEIKIRYKSGIFAARAKSAIYILPEWFDFVTGRVADPVYKGKRIITAEMKEIQGYHDEQKTAFAKLIKKIDEALHSPDLDRSNSEWLHDCIDCFHKRGKYTPVETEAEKIPSLLDFVGIFINEYPNYKKRADGTSLAKNSMKQYPVLKKHLTAFAQSQRRKDYEFADVTAKFYRDFVSFLQKKQFAANTIGKHVKQLKTILHFAKKKNLYSYDFGDEFTVLKEETDAIYLNESELQQLKEADLTKSPHLDRVRDCFLLLAWTGCRFSDLDKISADTNDGYLHFRQKKTNAKVVIPMHPVVAKILSKYNGNLPQSISNQKFNIYLKEVARIAGINRRVDITRAVGSERETKIYEAWDLISSHTGRRSFASNMYRRGVPSITIMAITGHRTETSFLKYIKVRAEEHAELMRKAWEQMYKH